MKAIILAAGRSRGAISEKYDMPKCLLKFGGESIISRLVRQLGHIGLYKEDIFVVTGYEHEKMKSISGVTEVYNPKYSQYDNAYSLFLALQHVNDDLLIMDGDIVFEDKITQEIQNSEKDTLFFKAENHKYGATGIIERDGKVDEIGKHVQTDKTYKGIAYLSKETIFAWQKLLQKPENWNYWYTVSLNRLIKNRKIRVKEIVGDIRDINTFFDYLEAKRFYGIENYTILITGATGLLGGKLYSILKRSYSVIGIGYTKCNKFESVDLTDKEKLRAYIELKNPQVIIHTAGIADPDECDADLEKAYAVNVRATQNLVNVSSEKDIKLIHISTDYVFDGNSQMPYEHESERNPLNYYGKTKKDAEDIVSGYENSLIVRIPIIYGYNGSDDKETYPSKIIRYLSERKEAELDNKQIRYPVLIDEVAFAIEKSLSKTGIIHLTSTEPYTKYTWGKTIAKTFGFDDSSLGESPYPIKKGRPPHIKLAVGKDDFELSNVESGTRILRKQMNCVFKLIYKSPAYEDELGRNIGQYRFELGKVLGQTINKDVLKDIDYVVPVPESGLYYAMGFSTETEIPYIQGLVKAHNSNRSFQLSDISLREQTIRSNIIPIKEFIRGKNVAIIDEAIFTGITLKVVCDMLKACSVGKMSIFIPTPLCRHRCAQYVQPDRMLLAEEMDKEDIKQYFGADELYFQSEKTFRKSIEDIPNVCFECFAGDQQ